MFHSRQYPGLGAVLRSLDFIDAVLVALALVCEVQGALRRSRSTSLSQRRHTKSDGKILG